MFFSTLLFILVAIILFLIFTKDGHKKKSIFTNATAGKPEHYKSIMQYLDKEIVINNGNKIYSSYDDRYKFIQVDGQSMEKYPGNIKNNSLVIVDTTVLLQDIIPNDPILLEKTREVEKNWCYKLRSVKEINDNTITSNNGSKHTMKKSSETIGVSYIGKVIIQSENFFPL